MPHEIEGRRLVLRGEIAATRKEIGGEVDDLRGSLAFASVALGALRMASPKFRWVSLLPTVISTVAALRGRRR
jgi:hypothetical protein